MSTAGPDRADDRIVRDRSPLIQIDPGWPFLLAGLAMLVAIALIPQQMAVEDAEATLWEAQEHERLLLAKIDAAKSMKQDLVDQKPDLMLRLALRRPPQKPVGTTVLVRQSRLRSVPELFEEVVDESFVPGPAPTPATGSTKTAAMLLACSSKTRFTESRSL